MHSAHRELEACPVRARLALDLGLATLSASRHVRLENKSSEKVSSSTRDLYRKCRDKNDADNHIYLELVYLVTALVPSDTACLASSPGRRRRTAVWISREVMVDLRTIQLQVGICEPQLNGTSCCSGLACWLQQRSSRRDR